MSGWFQDGWWGPATGGAVATSGSGGTGWFPRGWWPACWFAAPWWGPATGGAVATAPDLLAALVAYLKAAPTVTALIQAGSIFDEIAAPGINPPFLVVTRYTEQKPGRTADDQAVPLTVSILTANGLDAARAVGATVKAAIDSPAVNPASVRTARLAWTGGQERASQRGNSAPRRLPGIARGGVYRYAEEIRYTFHVTPSQ